MQHYLFTARLKAMTWKSHSTIDKQTKTKYTQNSSDDTTRYRSASLKHSSNTKESRNTSSKVSFAKVLRIDSPTRFNIPVSNNNLTNTLNCDRDEMFNIHINNLSVMIHVTLDYEIN